jgi:hypothetical protein
MGKKTTGIKIIESVLKPKPAMTPLGSKCGGFRLRRSTRYTLLPVVASLIFANSRYFCRMPKDIEPEISMEVSGKGECSSKVTKPLSPMNNEEIPEAVNEDHPGATSSPPSP